VKGLSGAKTSRELPTGVKMKGQQVVYPATALQPKRIPGQVSFKPIQIHHR